VSYQIPTLVFFDLGDVVCRFVPAERIKEFALLTGRTEQDLHDLVWESGLSAECDQGKYTLDQMCRAINDAIGSELDELTIIDAWRRAFVLNPDVYRIAREVSLKTKHALGYSRTMLRYFELLSRLGLRRSKLFSIQSYSRMSWVHQSPTQSHLNKLRKLSIAPQAS